MFPLLGIVPTQDKYSWLGPSEKRSANLSMWFAYNSHAYTKYHSQLPLQVSYSEERKQTIVRVREVRNEEQQLSMDSMGCLSPHWDKGLPAWFPKPHPIRLPDLMAGTTGPYVPGGLEHRAGVSNQVVFCFAFFFKMCMDLKSVFLF